MSGSSAGARTIAPDTEIPAFLRARVVRGYRGLNPLTRLAVVIAETVVALGVRGFVAPALVLAVVAVTAVWGGVAGRVLRILPALIPLALSIVLIDSFIYPGAKDVAVSIGPFDATWTGMRAAAEALLRVGAFALAALVFGFTTSMDDLVGELEWRGLPRRGAFVLASTLGLVPRTADRATEIVEAQRARGMDTEGGIVRRVRGLVPLTAPMIFGALTQVEERTLALEARGFSATGRRTLLRRQPDSTAQRALRWALLAFSVAVVAAFGSGALRLP